MQLSEAYLSRSLEVFIRLGLALALIVLCLQIMAPFVTTIVWGMIIAIALYPAYRKLIVKFRMRVGVVAVLFTATVLVALITPAYELSGKMAQNAHHIALDIKNGTLSVPPAPDSIKNWPIIGEQIHAGWSLFNENLEAAISRYKPELKSATNKLLASFARAGLGMAQFAVSIVIAGFFLAYAEASSDFAYKLGRRLVGEQGDKYTELVGSTVRSVAQGVLGVAFLQAMLAGLGFIVMDIPWAGLWTLIVLILATVQLSAGLIIVPTIIYVFYTADTLPAVLYMVWAVSVGLIDNVLKPMLMGRGVPVPTAVIFIGAIGGLIMIGFVGLFIGAVIMVLGYDLFMSWLNMEENAAPALSHDDDQAVIEPDNS